MSFSSFNSYMYKKGCIKCLVVRIYKINNTWKRFDFSIKEMPHTLQKNCFPSRMIDKIIKEYLDNNIDGEKKTHTEKKDEIRYFKLSYLGSISKQTRNKANAIPLHKFTCRLRYYWYVGYTMRNLLSRICKHVGQEFQFTHITTH